MKFFFISSAAVFLILIYTFNNVYALHRTVVAFKSYLLVFLGAFENLRKATISFVMSARWFVCMEQLDFHWTNFHEIWYFNIFRNCANKTEV
jgi:hypothetical protein